MRCEIPLQVLDPREQDGLAVELRRRAGLKTALTGYGQSSAVRIGLPGWRRKSSRVAHAAAGSASGLAAPGADAGGVERERGAMERERRLGAFVHVQRLAAEPVAAAAGREVVERPAAGGCGRGTIRRRVGARDAVLGSPRDRERGELRLDERGRVERLLVAAARRRLAPAPPVVAGQPQHRRRRARTRRRASAATRARGRPGRRGRARCRRDQRLREPRVVVGELVLEPAPVVGRRRARTRRRAGRRAARAAPARRGSSRSASRRERPSTAYAAVRSETSPSSAPTSAVEQPPRRVDDGRDPRGREDLAERPDRCGRRGRRCAARRASGGRSS